jgi:predicted methyltransferase
MVTDDLNPIPNHNWYTLFRLFGPDAQEACMAMRSSVGGSLAVFVLAAAIAAPAARQLSPTPVQEWIQRLESPKRIASLKIDQVIANIGLKPGMVVADVGAGPGVFSIPFARAVAPDGKVYAVEVDQAFVDHIRQKIQTEQVPNVTPVLGKFEDPSLPARDVDLAFFHDVLHHIAGPAAYLKTLAGYIKPGGRIAIIEMDPKTGSHKNDPEMQITPALLQTWMADAGLVPVEEVKGVYEEGKWFVIYQKK